MSLSHANFEFNQGDLELQPINSSTDPLCTYATLPELRHIQDSAIKSFLPEYSTLVDTQQRLRLRHWLPKISVRTLYNSSDTDYLRMGTINDSNKVGLGFEARLEFNLPELVADQQEIALIKEQHLLTQSKLKLMQEVQQLYLEYQRLKETNTQSKEACRQEREIRTALNTMTGNFITSHLLNTTNILYEK